MFTSKIEEEFFLSHLNYNHNVLEYGSGSSTFDISKKCKNLVSIEHQEDWYIKLKNNLPKNCNLILQKPDLPYIEGFDDGTYDQFKSYVNAPLKYGPFDVVLIDGRARVACSSIAHRICNEQSIIFIHDYDRIEYHEALNHLKLIEVVETMAKFKL